MEEIRGPVSESTVRVARELRVVVGRLRRRLKEVYDRRELTPSQISLLSLLGNGPASASDLAAAERVRPQSVAATLAVLAERGLVERHPDPEDGRRQMVLLSPAGREFFDGKRHAGEQWLACALEDRYTEAERATLIQAMALLERLTQP